MKKTPDYKKIYTDLLTKKHPDKLEYCLHILNKESFSSIDVIKLNEKIFSIIHKESNSFNQKHKSYDLQSIIQILGYQKKYNLSNIQLANHFKISRNTITKWKKKYSIHITNQ